MKILFGGTFDPVHNGHIALALHVAKQFNHPVEFLPLNGVPNYKPAPIASLQQRLAMLEMAIDKNKLLAIDYSETRIDTYSPTCQTLTRLRQKYGSKEPFYFIIGGDSLLSLETWDNWMELFSLTNLIVAVRQGYELNSLPPAISCRLSDLNACNLQQAAGQIIVTDFSPVHISSTQIRQNCKQALPLAEMVPVAVENYIKQQNLYR